MNPDANWDIHAFNLITQQKRTVCDIQGPQKEPAVSGNKIVWVDRRTGSANPDIFLFDGTQELQITSIASVKANPKICGNYIVWCDHRNGNQDIYMYNLSTGIKTPVCTDSAIQEFFEIYGTINDRILLEAVVFQNGTLNTLQSIAADLNGDQIINIDDVELMSMYCNGLISEFPFTKR